MSLSRSEKHSPSVVTRKGSVIDLRGHLLLVSGSEILGTFSHRRHTPIHKHRRPD